MITPEYIEVTKDPGNYLKGVLENGKYSKIAVLVDENTQFECLPQIQNYIGEFVIIKISSGEKNKTLDTCQFIWGQLTDAGFDRKGLLINVGGGVICDMGGFSAACFKRGIDFINIPTTLLAQVDASIGGKLGVDFDGLKNHIGVFGMPRKVIVSPAFLSTLEPRQFNSGFAEIVKHGLICDSQYFHALKNPDNYSEKELLELINHSIYLKNNVVEADPRENGRRKILNFGHTIGHAVESCFLKANTPLLHGEAVAIGMICEAYLSMKIMGLSTKDLEVISKSISETFQKVDISILEENEFLQRLNQDKKNEAKKIQAVLLREIGNAEYDVSITEQNALDSLEYYSSIIH